MAQDTDHWMAEIHQCIPSYVSTIFSISSSEGILQQSIEKARPDRNKQSPQIISLSRANIL